MQTDYGGRSETRIRCAEVPLIVNPDATSKFVVEPNWSLHPTKGGTITFAPKTSTRSKVPSESPLAMANFYDVADPGGQIKIGRPYSPLEQVVCFTEGLELCRICSRKCSPACGL